MTARAKKIGERGIYRGKKGRAPDKKREKGRSEKGAARKGEKGAHAHVPFP